MSTPQVLRIWRGNSAGGALVDFTVVVKEGQVVLDAVLALQAQQVGDLAVRWNCKAGKCGSCSAEINGYPLLMCTTRLSALPPGEPVTVTPLRTFPLIKDLVTDVSANYEKAKAVPPFTPRPPDGTHRMAQADVGRSQEFRKCIECWLCQDVCHVIRDHQGNEPAYSGPRFFIRYAELDMHPLDTLDRSHYVQETQGLGLCNITKCCTEVCPQGIKITDNAIIPLKRTRHRPQQRPAGLARSDHPPPTQLWHLTNAGPPSPERTQYDHLYDRALYAGN